MRWMDGLKFYSTLLVITFCSPLYYTFAQMSNGLDFIQSTQIGGGIISRAVWRPQHNEFAVSSTQGVDLYSMDLDKLTHLSEGLASSLAWSPEGELLAVVNSNQSIALWEINPTENQLLQQIETTDIMGDLYYLAWSPDGAMLAGGGRLGVGIWRVASGELLRKFDFSERAPLRVAWNPHSTTLAIGRDRSVHLYDVVTDDELHSFENVGSIPWIVFSPDGNYLATGFSNAFERYASQNSLRVWRVDEGELMTTIQAGLIDTLAWSPDGSLLATASSHEDSLHSVKFWDALSGEFVRDLSGGPHAHTRPIRSIQWSTDGEYVLTSAEDNTVVLWPWADSSLPTLQLQGYQGPITALSWSIDGTKLVTGSTDGRVRTWDAHTGSPQLTYTGHTAQVWTVTWDHNGDRIISGGGDYAVRYWNMTSPAEVKAYLHDQIVLGGQQGVLAVAVNDAGIVASGASDGLVRLENTSRYQPLFLSGHMGQVDSVNWNRDGTQIISGDGAVEIWNTENQEQLATLNCGELSLTYEVVYSPASNLIAGANTTNQVCVWDASSLELVQTLTGNVTSLNWNSTGDQLLGLVRDVASDQPVIQIWDVLTGETVWQSIPQADANVVAWSSDGHLAVGDQSGLIRIWEAITP